MCVRPRKKMICTVENDINVRSRKKMLCTVDLVGNVGNVSATQTNSPDSKQTRHGAETIIHVDTDNRQAS